MKVMYANQQKWYKPKEIAELGLIKNSTGNDSVHSNYAFILMLIKTGRIKAKNYGRTSRKHFLVPESEIVRYHNTISKMTEE